MSQTTVSLLPPPSFISPSLKASRHCSLNADMSLLGGVFQPASFTSSVGLLQAQLTGAVQASNGSISQVHITGFLAEPQGIIPALVVVAYLVIPVAIAAYLFQKRDMVGVG